MKIIGRSKALHSTWFFLPTYKLMLDCGEGACLELGTLASDVNYIFLSHMHIDHWSGLLSLARFQKRVFLKDKTKKMGTILYHPSFTPKIQEIKNFLESEQFRLYFKYQEIREGQYYHLRDQFFIKPFLVEHNASYYKTKQVATGLHLIEKRKRLNKKMLQEKEKIEKKFYDDPHKAKEEFTKFIIEQKQKYGEETLIEWYDYKILSYCGDSRPVPDEEVKDTELLMHECTFFEDDEMEAAHSSVEEAVMVAKKSKCKNLILYHFSERYFREKINYIEKAQKIAKKHLSIPVYIVPVNKLFIKNT